MSRNFADQSLASEDLSGSSGGSLQVAYDASTTPEIVLDATRGALTIQDNATPVGILFEVQDNAAANLFEVDVDRVTSEIPMEIGDTSALDPIALRYRPTFAPAGAFIGGFIQSAADVTYSNAVFIWALLAENSVYRAAVDPGFAAFTLFNALPRIVNSGNFDLVQAIVLNVGVQHERSTSGTSTTVQTIGLSFSAQGKTTVSGAVLTYTTGMVGLAMSPKFSTVAGSTVNLGTIIAVNCFNPAVGLFQPSAGTETMTGYIGLNFANMTFGGNVTKIVVNSALTPASLSFFLLNGGGAQSDFGGGFLLDCGFVQIVSDTLGVSLGLGPADVQILWNGTNLVYNPIIGDNMNVAFATDLHTITSDSASEDSAIAFNYAKGSFGEGGTPGNNKWRFVTQAETITIGGDFTQFLVSQAANDTIDVAINTYAGFTFNAPTPTIGAGSLVTSVALNIGGNPGAASTNRVGVRIISNPSGASAVNAALWVTAGLSLFDGIVEIGSRLDTNLTTVTGTTHTAANEHIILVDDDTAGSTVTVTLPAVSGITTLYHIKKLGTTANVIVDGNAAETIDGALTAVLTSQYESIMLVTDGTSWHVI